MKATEVNLEGRNAKPSGSVSVETLEGKIVVYGRTLTVGVMLGICIVFCMLGTHVSNGMTANHFLALSLLISLVCALIVFGLQRNWGQVALIAVGWATAGAGLGFLAGLGISLALCTLNALWSWPYLTFLPLIVLVAGAVVGAIAGIKRARAGSMNIPDSC